MMQLRKLRLRPLFINGLYLNKEAVMSAPTVYDVYGR